MRELLIRAEQVLWSEESPDQAKPRSLALATEEV
jgi:hypothetical protein